MRFTNTSLTDKKYFCGNIISRAENFVNAVVTVRNFSLQRRRYLFLPTFMEQKFDEAGRGGATNVWG